MFSNYSNRFIVGIIVHMQNITQIHKNPDVCKRLIIPLTNFSGLNAVSTLSHAGENSCYIKICAFCKHKHTLNEIPRSFCFRQNLYLVFRRQDRLKRKILFIMY